MKHFYLFCLVNGALCIALSGCSRSGIQGLVPASGTVYFDGKPLDGASIIFTPAADSGSDKYAAALSQSGGKFVLETRQYPGVLPGKYNVAVSKTETIVKVSAEEAERLHAAMEEVPSEMVYHIPQVYSDAVKSGITAEIGVKGDRNIRIDLK